MSSKWDNWFCFQRSGGGDARDYVSVYSSGAFCSQSKSKLGRSDSITQIKFSLEFIRNNCFQICSKICCDVICILMDSDPVQLYAKPCFIVFTYLTGWRTNKYDWNNYKIEIKIGNKFVLTDELITINNGDEFVNNNNEIYPAELFFLK